MKPSFERITGLATGAAIVGIVLGILTLMVVNPQFRATLIDIVGK